MLQTFRNFAGTAAIKVLFVLIIFSFIAWGVGDVFRGLAGDSSIAKVGDRKISPPEFDAAYREQAARYSAAAGGELNDMMQMMVKRQVLSGMVNQAVLAEEAAAMGLAVSDKRALKIIADTPAFQTDEGKFDKERFSNYLRRAGMSEKRYVARLKEETAIGDLLGAVSEGYKPPKALAEALYVHAAEKRKLEVAVVPASAAGAVPEPSEDDLRAFYEKNEKRFMSPEYRSVSYIHIKAEDVAKGAAVSDDEVKAEFDEHAGEYGEPEKRVLLQMTLQDQAKAEAALKAVKGGDDFVKAAKEIAGQDEKTVRLGKLAASDLPEEAREIILKLGKGEVSDIVQTPFGFSIYKVEAIEPAKAADFAQVKAKVADNLRRRKAEDELYALAGKVEDLIASSANAEAIAAELNLKKESLGPVSAEGKAPDGTLVKLPEVDKFAEVILVTDDKATSDLKEDGKGGYYLLTVDSVIPAHSKALEEIRGKLAEEWKAEKKQELYKKAAEDIAVQAGEKKSLEPALKAGASLKAVTVARFDDGRKEALPKALIVDAFAKEAGGATAAYGGADGAYSIALVKEIVKAKAGDGEIKEVEAAYQDTVANEAIGVYVGWLKEKHGVEVNFNALGVPAE